MRSVALDWGNRIAFCEVKNGLVVARATVSTLDALKGLLGPTSPPAEVAIEASRDAWFVMLQLRKWGHLPVLVDTTRVKQLGIGHHRRKNDRIDAEVLARAVEEKRIPKAHELSAHRQELRLAGNARALLVSHRASLVVAIRGDARTRGVRLPSVGTDKFAEMVRRTDMPRALAELVEPLLNVLEQLELQIVAAEKRLDALSKLEPMVEVLKTTPGIGAVTAAAFVSVIDDPKRFDSAHKVQSYLGLVPSENTSGKKRLGSITKQGNSYLRSMLVEGAWTLLVKPSKDPLAVWGAAVRARRGHRVAVVALARRLAGILWAMWRDNRVYDPRLLGQASALGLERQAESQLFRAAALKSAGNKKLRALRRGKNLKALDGERDVAVATKPVAKDAPPSIFTESSLRD